MIAPGDNIVSISYPRRDLGGNEKTDTYTLVGTPENISATVAGQVETWLKSGSSGPLTLHVTSRYSIIDVDRRQS